MVARSEKSSESGSVAVGTAIVVFAVTLVSSVVVLLVIATFRNLDRERRLNAGEVSAWHQLDDVIDALADDPTPDSDGPTDPVWDYLADRTETISLQDVSSALNPNWIRPTLLERTDLGNLLRPGVSPVELRDYRNEAGFSLDIASHYEEFFLPEIADEYLTPYGYLNFNVSYETVLHDIFFLRTGDAGGADTFLERVRSVLREIRVIDHGELQEFLGLHYDAVYPVITTEPAWNVHFLHEQTLRAVLSYPFGETPIPNNETYANYIVDQRANREFDAAEIQQLVQIEPGPQERAFAYLGTKTWFWRVTVQIEAGTLEAVVVRVPVQDGGSDVERDYFRVVEWEFVTDTEER